MARWRPRTRTILGGTLALGLAVGIWFSDKLPKMGRGFGLGNGGSSVVGQSAPTSSAGSDAENSNSAKSTDESGPKPSRTDSEPLDDVLTILVEDRHYAVWRKTRKGNGYFPAELSELVQLSLDAKPNEDGLRVRIIRSESARLTAWQKLQSELVVAGIPAEAITLQKELLK